MLVERLAAMERADGHLATSIEHLAEVTARVASIRTRAAQISCALDAMPEAVVDADHAVETAIARERAAAEALAAAEDRVAELHTRRRPSPDDVDQAGRELQRGQEERRDAAVALRRRKEHRQRLDADEQALRAEADELVRQAELVASEIAGIPRVPVVGKGAPGGTLRDLEEWGAQTRAALFVARGGLETERERLVDEANALGSAVLGEPLGASSAALVRRRIEQALG